MKRVKALHLASFAGNIGDIANHQSFYHQLGKLKDFSFEIEELEIRDFYKVNQVRKFDEEFVEYVNQFDLFILGGGNFFELCWDYSKTGTTFDISTELLKKIKVPIFINAIGIDDNKGTNKTNICKFKLFLDALFENNRTYFTVRNDGSSAIVNKYFRDFSNVISTVPDWGFGLNEISDISSYKSKQTSIGFNIAVDMLDLRYKQISYQQFIKILSEQINHLLKKTKYNIILFPHIQSDYNPITDLLQLIDPKYVRSSVSVAPLIQKNELDTFKLYKDCDMLYAMRFHSNICAMSLGIPTYGLLSYPKHNQLYKEINMLHRKIDPNEIMFAKEIERETLKLIEDDGYLMGLKKEYADLKSEIDKEIRTNLSNINKFLQDVM